MNKNTDLQDGHNVEKRSATVAAIFGILSPGLGLLYAGKGRMAVLAPVVCLVLIAFFSWTRLLLWPLGYWALITSMLVFVLCTLVFACSYARKASSKPIFWYQRWYIYILFLVITQGAFLAMAGDKRPAIFGYETHRIPSGSMTPTLVPGDFVLSDSWEVLSKEIEIGDVVTFNYPSSPGQVWIKRIIALPGDTVEIIDGVVTVSGVRLHEPYVELKNNVRTARKNYSVTVPEGHYFVLGDNRDNSADSRTWGFVPRDNVRAKLVNIWLSIGDQGVQSDRIGRLSFD